MSNRFLWWCLHKWNFVDSINVWKDTDDSSQTDRPGIRKYILQCEHCGNLKEFKVKGK